MEQTDFNKWLLTLKYSEMFKLLVGNLFLNSRNGNDPPLRVICFYILFHFGSMTPLVVLRWLYYGIDPYNLAIFSTLIAFLVLIMYKEVGSVARAAKDGDTIKETAANVVEKLIEK